MRDTQPVSSPLASMCFLCNQCGYSLASTTYFSHIQKHPLQKATLRASCTLSSGLQGNKDINILNAHGEMHCLFQSPAMFAFKSNL